MYNMFATVYRGLVRPVSFTLRKGADRIPMLQTFVSAYARGNNIDEKEAINLISHVVVFFGLVIGTSEYMDKRTEEKMLKETEERCERMFKMPLERLESLEERCERMFKMPLERLESLENRLQGMNNKQKKI